MNTKDKPKGSVQERFQFLLKDHERIVFKVVNTYARNAEDQSDLSQEIAVQLWRAFRGYDESRKFTTWMYQIALNVAISWSRRARTRDRFTVPISDSHLAPESAAQSDDVRILRQLIAGLDELNRALLLLYLEERPHAEIAEIVGISVANVATRISRIKDQLRKQVASDNFTQQEPESHGTR